MKEIAVMRSRFQPFTKGHYEAIRSYYLYRENKADLRLPKKLVLCVVRDFDAVRMATPQVGDKFITGSETPEEQALCFRHLVFFNPFSSYEVIDQIWHSLRCLAAEDELSYLKPEYNEFLNNIRVVLCPLKFGELLEALRQDYFAPDHLKRYVNIQNLVMEILQKEGVARDLLEKLDKALREGLDKALREFEKDIVSNVLDVWARFARDLLPINRDTAIWLMPIFDQEDLNDFHKMREMGFSVYHLIMDQYKCECVPELLGEGTVGLYGLFVQYVLMLLAQEGIVPSSQTIGRDRLETHLKTHEEKLSSLLCPHIHDQYKERLKEKISFAKDVLKTVPQKRLSELLQSPRWDEAFVRELWEIQAGPYLVLIGFLRTLAQEQFRSVVDQIRYPASIPNLDDQYKVNYEKMKGGPVAAVEDALSSLIVGELSSDEYKVFSNIKQLVKTVNSDERLKTLAVSDGDCATLFIDLATAVRERKLEAAKSLYRKIRKELRLKSHRRRL